MKSERQKFKEKYKLPWSVKVMTQFWARLKQPKHKPKLKCSYSNVEQDCEFCVRKQCSNAGDG